MKLLLVKTSSLGDVLHAMPALSEASERCPGLEIHWMVEEQYQEIPAWHPAVGKVIPVALRRWRKSPLYTLRSAEWRSFRSGLKSQAYDLVIDAQGLLKSAVLARQSRGPLAGYDRRSAREWVASLLYHQRYAVPRDQHAVERIRQLFAAALGYPLGAEPPEYGLRLTEYSGELAREPYLVWVHGSAWRSKIWPKKHWVELSYRAVDAGYKVYVPWGGDVERERAEDLAHQVQRVETLPSMNLTELASLLSGAAAVVGVDTGLAHLAAAVATPSITLYGPTDPRRTGTWGRFQHHMAVDYPCAPCLNRQCPLVRETDYSACFDTLPPEVVWEKLRDLLGSEISAGGETETLTERISRP